MNGNYEPSNCCWIPRSQQARNIRSTIKLTAFGETKSIYEWEADPRCQVSANTLKQRIRLTDWTPEHMVTTPSIRMKLLAYSGTDQA